MSESAAPRRDTEIEGVGGRNEKNKKQGLVKQMSWNERTIL